MELKDLRKSVSACTEDELRALLLDIRHSRRVTKKAPAKAKKATVQSDSNASLDALMASLSPEQIMQLLSKHGG